MNFVPKSASRWSCGRVGGDELRIERRTPIAPAKNRIRQRINRVPGEHNVLQQPRPSRDGDPSGKQNEIHHQGRAAGCHCWQLWASSALHRSEYAFPNAPFPPHRAAAQKTTIHPTSPIGRRYHHLHQAGVFTSHRRPGQEPRHRATSVEPRGRRASARPPSWRQTAWRREEGQAPFGKSQERDAVNPRRREIHRRLPKCPRPD